MQSSEPQTCQVNQTNSRVAGIPHVSTHMDITYNSVQCTCMSDSRLSSKASVSSISWFCLFSRPACRIKTICDLLRNAAIYARRSQTDLLSSSLPPQPLHSLLPSFLPSFLIRVICSSSIWLSSALDEMATAAASCGREAYVLRPLARPSVQTSSRPLLLPSQV